MKDLVGIDVEQDVEPKFPTKVSSQNPINQIVGVVICRFSESWVYGVGTIISIGCSTAIITSAHMIRMKTDNKWVDSNFVFFARAVLTESKKQIVEYYKVDKVCVHPKFTGLESGYDIALLQFSKELNPNQIRSNDKLITLLFSGKKKM